MQDGEHQVEGNEPPYERMFQRAVEVFTGTDQERVLIKVRRAIERDDEAEFRSLLGEAYADLTTAYVAEHYAMLEARARKKGVPRDSTAEVVHDALLAARASIGTFERAEGDIFGPPDFAPSPFASTVEAFVGRKVTSAILDSFDARPEVPDGDVGEDPKVEDGEDPSGNDVIDRFEAEELAVALEARRAITKVVRDGLEQIDRHQLRSPDLRAMKRTPTLDRFDRLLDPVVRRFLALVDRVRMVRVPPKGAADLVHAAFIAEAHGLTDLSAAARHKFTSRNESEPKHAVMVALVFGLSLTDPKPGTPAAAARWNLEEMLIELQADYAVRLAKRLAGHVTQTTHISVTRFRTAIDGLDQLFDHLGGETDPRSRASVAVRARREIHATGTTKGSAFERATALVGTDHAMASQARDLLDLDERLASMIREAGGSSEADDESDRVHDDEEGDPA